jgi:hypothetical protein
VLEAQLAQAGSRETALTASMADAQARWQREADAVARMKAAVAAVEDEKQRTLEEAAKYGRLAFEAVGRANSADNEAERHQRVAGACVWLCACAAGTGWGGGGCF